MPVLNDLLVSCPSSKSDSAVTRDPRPIIAGKTTEAVEVVISRERLTPFEGRAVRDREYAVLSEERGLKCLIYRLIFSLDKFTLSPTVNTLLKEGKVTLQGSQQTFRIGTLL